MRVSPDEPYKVIYSLYQHEFLGYLIEPYVVKINHKGQPTLLYQSISLQNFQDFTAGTDSSDMALMRLIEEIRQENILKKFNPKKWSLNEFFERIFDPQKGDKILKDSILEYLEKRRVQILEQLRNKPFFVMSKDGNPSWQAIEWVTDQVRVYFHFNRNDENTHYFPILKCNNERLNIRNTGTLLLSNSPAWLLIANKLYHFEKHVDGKKLRPFLKNNHIVIPKSMEEQYYQKFILPLISSYDVFAQGFDIVYETASARPRLLISETPPSAPPLLGRGASLDTPSLTGEGAGGGVSITLDLSFRYGKFTFRYDAFAIDAHVSLEKSEESYIFHKLKRDLKIERSVVSTLKNHGLDIKNGRIALEKYTFFAWLQQHRTLLEDLDFEIVQNVGEQKHYFVGYSSINININENRDWFDIYAVVRFGEFEIPFIQLKNLILNKKREFKLPNGQVAVIPQSWLTQYSELFAFTVYNTDNEQVTLPKHLVGLVNRLAEDSLAVTVMNRKLEQFSHFEGIEEYELPNGFFGNLRPYQKAGYDWMRFLNEYHLGGCLADDMGLGKTIQTLALLQSQKENNIVEPSLLVVPTSLLYNWEIEAQKFTPQLKIFVYRGANREKNTTQFEHYDIILTSYGTLRIDIEMLKNYRFNYVILDESQAIKNPTSSTTKAVFDLNSRHKLILTGTPLENSTMDLWSQMTFINPGLLGNQSFFRNTYQNPIEKEKDEAQSRKLYGIIKPFILRRHKSQVATDLPPKIENVQYCDMTDDQNELYEETKSYFRNMILNEIDENGIGKSQLLVIQGLTKLRQLANHPRMIDENYEGNAGKLDDVLNTLETILTEGHKVLIFSQFVKHLTIVRQQLDSRQIRYAYLDGSTTDRQQQVTDFQENNDTSVFLISLKAGGVGLNLTAADYVFILDPWWNPAIEAQAIDRAHRIGQDKTVFTYKFITKNSIEEKILELQKSKKRLFDELITNEESFTKSLTKDDVLGLLS